MINIKLKEFLVMYFSISITPREQSHTDKEKEQLTIN